MIYDIRHVTTYAYESQVSFARCSLRLEPRSGDGQQLISHSVEIRPRPADRAVRRDFFGTHTESILIETAHRSLRIDSRSRVSVSRKALDRAAPSPSWDDIRDVAFEATSLGPASPVGYVFASALVPVQAPVTAYAAASFPPGGGILSGAADLMRRIRNDFRYDPKATVISTPLREVFEKRHGVCQDFAHVMIAGLRGLGLPAAYVSGYLRTIPPPGRPRLQGADATHAWVSVWCGAELGWVGFDPTNDIMVENDHIVLAIGRDFSDVSPVDGIIVGSRKQKLGVAVDVVPVESGDPHSWLANLGNSHRFLRQISSSAPTFVRSGSRSLVSASRKTCNSLRLCQRIEREHCEKDCRHDNIKRLHSEMMIGSGDQAAHAKEASGGAAAQANHGHDAEPEEALALPTQQIAVEIGAHILQLFPNLDVQAIRAELFDQPMEHVARLHVIRYSVIPVAVRTLVITLARYLSHAS